MELTQISDDEIQGMVEKHAELANFLLGAPESIAKLGQLMLVATCAKDFPIQQPEGGLKYAQYPSSFCANLVQVVHAGYNAFTTAENNIEELAMHTQRVPGMVEDVFALLENHNVAHGDLQFSLQRIVNVANVCTNLVDKVEDKLNFAAKLTNELAEASTATHAAVQYKYEGDNTIIDLQKLDTAKIQQTLIEGVKSLADVRAKWHTIGEFFREFAQLVTVEMNETLQTFAKYSGTVVNRMASNHTEPSIMAKKMLFERAMKINKVAFQIVMLAETYLAISNEHLVPTSRNLSVLIALDPNTEMSVIQQKQQTIMQVCENARKSIENHAQANRATVMNEFRGLMSQMNNYVMQGQRP